MPAPDTDPEGPALRATYSFESYLSSGEAADLLAEEQSTGRGAPTTGRGDTADVAVLEVSEGSLTLGYSTKLVSSVPSLVVLLQGEVLELGAFESLRLEDIGLSEAAVELFPGPGYGPAGIRALVEVPSRPVVAAILKPSVGLAPEEAAKLAESYASGGADIVKDDELASSSYDELAARCRAVAESLARASERRGRPAAYALNITGPVDELGDRVDLCHAFENVWPMVCEYAIGLDALRMVRERSYRPILCHRAGAGAMIRSGSFGMSQRAQVTLSRLCGADLVHCGSFRGKLFDREAGEVDAVSAASRPLGGRSRGVLASMPLIGGGFGAAEAKAAGSELRTPDICFVFGASVAFAPAGPVATVAEIVSALEDGCDVP